MGYLHEVLSEAVLLHVHIPRLRVSPEEVEGEGPGHVETGGEIRTEEKVLTIKKISFPFKLLTIQKHQVPRDSLTSPFKVRSCHTVPNMLKHFTSKPLT